MCEKKYEPAGKIAHWQKEHRFERFTEKVLLELSGWDTLRGRDLT